MIVAILVAVPIIGYALNGFEGLAHAGIVLFLAAFYSEHK